MRKLILIISVTAAVATGGAIAADQWAQPLDIYQCPAHPDIQATWPAQCPTCGAPLQPTELSGATGAGTSLAADTNYYYYPSQSYPSFPPTPQYGSQGYSSYPPSYPYGTQGFPPAPQYGDQGYTYPPSYSYGSPGYPPSDQYGSQGYPPYSGYPYSGQGYPPGTQYGGPGYYPPNYPYGGQSYPSYPPSYPYGSPSYPPYGYGYGYGYGQGGYAYPPSPYIPPAEPNSPYGSILEQLNRLFNRNNENTSPMQ